MLQHQERPDFSTGLALDDLRDELTPWKNNAFELTSDDLKMLSLVLNVCLLMQAVVINTPESV